MINPKQIICSVSIEPRGDSQPIKDMVNIQSLIVVSHYFEGHFFNNTP